MIFRTMLLAGLLLMPSLAAGQDARLDSMRTELVRTRGFIRGAETQLSKTLAILDSILAAPQDSTEPPPPVQDGTLLVSSNWDTQGTNSAALFDNGKWADISGWNAIRLEVVPSSPGAPTPNMLRHFVRQNDSDEGWIDMAIDAGVELEIGQRITWRWYQNPQEATSWFTDHGIAFDAGGLNSGRPWFTEDARTSTHQRVGWQFANNEQFTIGGADYNEQNLELNRWYRFEVSFEQIDQNSYIMLPSVWDAVSGALIAGPDNWLNTSTGTPMSALTFAGDIRADAVRFVGFCGGIDPPGSIRDGVAADYAAIAAVLGAEVGPYDPARGY